MLATITTWIYWYKPIEQHQTIVEVYCFLKVRVLPVRRGTSKYFFFAFKPLRFQQLLNEKTKGHKKKQLVLRSLCE